MGVGVSLGSPTPFLFEGCTYELTREQLGRI